MKRLYHESIATLDGQNPFISTCSNYNKEIFANQ